MRTLLVTFFYILLGFSQSEVYQELGDTPYRDGFFAGEPAVYIYENDITHIICLKDSICFEVGVYAPKEYYENYQELCDTSFIGVGNDLFFYENYRVAFFKAKDPDKFFMVGYESENYK